MSNTNVKKVQVSVIITAYNRAEFCMDAISSVLNQDKPRHEFEIIVVKNFYKEEIDNLIRANNIISIFRDNCKLGEMLSTGIMAASGELICFLDDDDLFTPNKISHVIGVFEGCKDLNYYHHKQDIRDINLIPLKTIYSQKTPSGKFFLRASEINQQFQDLMRKHILLSSLFFNLSSIAIRKEIVLKRLDYLSEIVTHPEDFMMFAALTYSKDSILLQENASLTIYRSHDSLSNIQKGSNTPILERKKLLFEKDIASSHVIIKLCTNYPFLERIMRLRLSYEKYIYAILTKNKASLFKEFKYLAFKKGLTLTIRRPFDFLLGTPLLYLAFVLTNHSGPNSAIQPLVNKFIIKIL